MALKTFTFNGNIIADSITVATGGGNGGSQGGTGYGGISPTGTYFEIKAI